MAGHRKLEDIVFGDDGLPKKEAHKEKVKTPSTSSSEEPPRRGKGMSTSLDLDDHMNFDQKLQDKR